ncbi:MAG: S-methyl-5-thioribose-1-phosphate isomerase [Bacteroidales bacterium]|nr:S-methyl-5-thioribose-1-phosphate isomerase [Bacteroidales bacterium]MCF8333584.1 S-methyl-5-thioribose-1-phosphate isomerase [Bacteroidales bacterium]
MKVGNNYYTTVWADGQKVCMIDQTKLPYHFEIFEAESYLQTCKAIKNMVVRGAGAIGAAAGYAMAQACREAPKARYEQAITRARKDIEATRPTAQNLFFATKRVYEAGKQSPQKAVEKARSLAEENIDEGKKIGEYGNTLIKDGSNIETHCNAGWLAFVDHGSALAPIYRAKREGKKMFIYADETRPRGQGARLTAWELKNEDIPHAIIADNAGAWLMAQNKIDMVIVGADRIAANGDVANKIGTLEKAIAAYHYGVPFYVTAPVSTIDFACDHGREIVIEERAEEEVLFQEGPDAQGKWHKISVSSPGSGAVNPAFDVTPAQYISAIITEKGIVEPSQLQNLK